MSRRERLGVVGLMVRYGIDGALELRPQVPDVIWTDPELSVGPLGFGAEVGGALSERSSVSLVPELLLDAYG